jgi:hypothetical protein
MPEIKNFPRDYGTYTNGPFKAFVLVENEAAGYRRFISDPYSSVSRLIKPYTPVFFITNEEANMLIELNKARRGERGALNSNEVAIVAQVVNRLPSRDIDYWQLLKDDNLAHIVAFN